MPRLRKGIIDLQDTGTNTGVWGNNLNIALEKLNVGFSGVYDLVITSNTVTPVSFDFTSLEPTDAFLWNVSSATDLGADVTVDLISSEYERIILVRNNLMGGHSLGITQGGNNAGTAVVANGDAVLLHASGTGATSVVTPLTALPPSFASLSDTLVVSAARGHILRYDGTRWISEVQVPPYVRGSSGTVSDPFRTDSGKLWLNNNPASTLISPSAARNEWLDVNDLLTYVDIVSRNATVSFSYPIVTDSPVRVAPENGLFSFFGPPRTLTTPLASAGFVLGGGSGGTGADIILAVTIEATAAGFLPQVRFPETILSVFNNPNITIQGDLVTWLSPPAAFATNNYINQGDNWWRIESRVLTEGTLHAFIGNGALDLTEPFSLTSITRQQVLSATGLYKDEVRHRDMSPIQETISPPTGSIPYGMDNAVFTSRFIPILVTNPSNSGWGLRIDEV